MAIKERSEIAEKYKWNLTIMYKDDQAWHRDFEKLAKEIKAFSKFKGIFTVDANTLADALRASDEISRQFEKLASYAMRKSDEDTRNTIGTELKSKITSLGVEFGENASFFEPELIELGWDKIGSYIKTNTTLKVYRHYLANILRYKPHILSLAEEKILASTNEITSTANNVFTKLNNADIKFGDIKDEKGNVIELSKGNYGKYVASQDRAVRKNAFETLYKSYKDLKNTFAETLIGDIKANYFMSKSRKYKNPLAMSLYNNNIDIKVYDNVINTINNNLDKMHKYVAMKKEVLGLQDFHMYDFYVDLIKEYDVEYEYEDALKIIFGALKPLGSDYINNAKKIFDERWIDVFECKGKMAGAYSSFGYDTPPYILLNYNGKLDSVGTIIHELGHSMHSYYSALKKPYIYHEYSIFVAEVASNVNEMLLNMYMLDNAKDNQERLSLINDFLESIKGSIYRQGMFAEFEKKIYELEGSKQTLTEETLSNLYYDLNKKYYGDAIVPDDDIRYEWMRIPHLYYQFYVYQYATGLTAAFFIARDLYQGNAGMKEKYIEFLSSGSSDYPLDLLKRLGIDMNSEEPINRILEYFDKKIDEFSRIIKEK
ncbi:MAG: oligoendopeptidase F [Bacilli bacterium]|jgi:oligoendopeptidase F